MRLEVDSGGYDSAAEALESGNPVLAGGYTSLTGKLGGYSSMAGDETSSEDFVKNYDSAAAETVAAFAELTTAFGNLSLLTAASGANHREANRKSVYKKAGVPAGNDKEPQPEIVSTDTPPSSVGGDNADMPEFWNLIVDHLQGWAWPSADTGKLREAASTWRAAAGTIDRAPSYASVASSQLGRQRSPEVAFATSALRELRTSSTDLAEQCRELATACDDYAEQVDKTRETIKDLVRDLAIEIGATAVISGIASFVTFGGAAVVGGGVATARAVSCARNIIKALVALKAVRAVAVMARTLPKVRGIRTALKKFQTIRAVRRSAKNVDKQLWSPGRFRSNPKNAFKHFKKHKDEFPELKNSKEYVEAAKKFMTDPPAGTYTRVREPGGDILRYDPKSGTLGIMTKDGVMKTMFKPEAAKVQQNGFRDVWDYFLHG
ncbi:hypothetical protein GCM10011376_03670 [Nocardioides flavus (ex Wang et al. 2016)]|uniref:Outer membrane channel protein CpnT-like N-terminal domain-containing protein n=1 Tax=Nocardioides flavus (ex Wang et al. 2016) TaxID=2058780 RepID=A0ABQ3HGG6_9ACTN|nr:hypothetical protein [Nocardioides flavus (ex Wang et al. 2016)]GHE15453.1 hypothetical protein GCM10011376_03670 [Nocardioides flavus (ex Wang et al. 2016)]